MWKVGVVGLLGLVIFVAGAWLGGGYLVATAPGAKIEAIKAVAVVGSIRTVQFPIGFAKLSLAQSRSYEGFVFMDATGLPHVGEDEVSDVFLLAHPLNSRIDVFYAADDPDHAVIGAPERLVTRDTWKGFPAVLLLGFGGFLVAGAASRANARRLFA
jgi:hypothetical protein